MIKTFTPPTKKRSHSQPEHKLQAECVRYFSETYPERRGELFATFQETKSQGQGGVMLSLGLVSGVSDLLFVQDGFLIGIEMKCPETSHNTEHLIKQAKWLLKVPKRGCFCDSLDMFKEIIAGGEGIDPKSVLEYCKKVKTKSITWNYFLFI